MVGTGIRVTGIWISSGVGKTRIQYWLELGPMELKNGFTKQINCISQEITKLICINYQINITNPCQKIWQILHIPVSKNSIWGTQSITTMILFFMVISKLFWPIKRISFLINEFCRNHQVKKMNENLRFIQTCKVRLMSFKQHAE